MYSPRIREALIPRVYRAAKETGIPMTAWVNRAIEGELRKKEHETKSEVRDADGSDDPAASKKGARE